MWGCLAIATVGNWLGGLTSYWIGWLGRWDWIERWFKVKREKLEQQKGHVDRYGVWLALFTWLPIVGDLFAIALGFTDMDREGLLIEGFDRKSAVLLLLYLGCESYATHHIAPIKTNGEITTMFSISRISSSHPACE